jgi:quinol monooxygenase YgiN
MAIQSIVATIKVKAGQEAAFQAVALKLAAAVNANEPGCMLYTLNKGEDASTFVFMERYKDEDAMKAHRGMDHFRTLGKEMGAFMDGPPSVLRMVELG